MKFKVMTFNVGGFFSEREDKYSWENRADLSMKIIHNYNPDLIGFQEVQFGNLAFFREHLGDYEIHLGVPTFSEENERAIYNPIFWKKDEFEKSDFGGFYLSQTPDKWSKSWDSMYVRGATWIKLQCAKTGDDFFYLNTHLDHHSEQARIEGSKIIVNQIAKIREKENIPVILTGDFNSRVWAPPDESLHAYPFPIIQDSLPPAGAVYGVYKDNCFQDTYLEGGYINMLNMNTYHDFYGEAFPPVALRIDWILILDGIKKIRTEEFEIIRYAKPPIYPSDHYPVIAKLVWE